MKKQKDLDKINEHIWSFIGQVRCARTFMSLSTKSEYMHHNDAVDYANGFVRYAIDHDVKFLDKNKDYIQENHPQLFELMSWSMSLLIEIIKELELENAECYPNHKPNHIK